MSELGYRILLVEDEEPHAALVHHIFRKEAPADQLSHVVSAQDLLAQLDQSRALRTRFDLLILDYSLPDLDGIELMKELQQRQVDLPVIIITGHGDESVAVQLMKLGASDYITKSAGFPNALPTISHKVIQSSQLKRRFEEAERHLRFQALLLDNVHDAIIGTDMENEIIYWNHGAERIFGWKAEDIIGNRLERLFPELSEQEWQSDSERLRDTLEINGRLLGITSDQRRLWLSMRCRLIRDTEGSHIGVLNVAQDITEQIKLQEQTERQIKKTAIINKILTLVTATTELHEMLPRILALLTEVFECDQVWLDPCENAQAFFAASQPTPETLNPYLQLQTELSPEFFKELCGYLLEHAEAPLVLDETSFDNQNWREFLQRNQVRSQLFLVLRPRTTSPLILGLWNTNAKRKWTQEEQALLAEVARIVALAIEKSFLYKRAHDAATREQLINRITQAISQSLDIEEILQTICEELGKNLNVDRCHFIEVTSKTQGVITHEYCRPEWPKMVGNVYDRNDFGAEVDAFWRGEPLVFNVSNSLSPIISEKLTDTKIKSSLSVPVLHNGKLIGSIGLNQCGYYRNWTDDEIRLLQALARQCAIALNNAQLYSESRKSEERYRSLFENANDAIIIADVETGAILDANTLAERLTGHDRNRLLELHLSDLHPQDERDKYQRLYDSLSSTPRVYMRDALVTRKDGGQLPIELSASVIGIDQGAVIQALLRDMTEQRKLERQLFHAQRLESIGTLTGGIAHDFNNLLAGILGYAELFKKKIDPSNSKLYNYATIIEQSATHGAELAQRLVAFARGGSLKSQSIDLNNIIEDTLKLLRRALGRTIEIQSQFEPRLRLIEANGTQIQQILMNLCINARDAMPNGGRLTVATKNMRFTESKPAPGLLKPGHYVVLSVSDTGTGMDQDTLSRIFEPFFTTKEIGKGTGLGLAMVSSIVREAGGYIAVETELSRGTTFHIYLLAAEQTTSQLTEQTASISGGNETILVVDDEETLRYLAKDLLEAYGYRVILAADGFEALDIYRQQYQEIELVLLDMVMPRMSGREIYHRLIEINPKAKVVFASGYCPPEEIDQIWQDGTMRFVQKPYQIEDLAAELRTVLDGKN